MGSSRNTAPLSVEASFGIGSENYHLQPDRFGAFPRVSAAAKQTIPVTVQYSQGDVGETVVVQTVDGGELMDSNQSVHQADGKQIVQQVQLDSQLSAQFNFQTGNQGGNYRVAVSYRGQIQTLQFWVGPPPQMKSMAMGQ